MALVRLYGWAGSPEPPQLAYAIRTVFQNLTFKKISENWCQINTDHEENMAMWYTCIIWAASWQNQQNDCAPSEDSSEDVQADLSLRWALSYPLSTQRRLWSDWADVQADLSTRWAQSHFVDFCWFFHEAAHFSFRIVSREIHFQIFTIGGPIKNYT